ncbi:MAG TPA: hypothetical protein VMV57_05170 [Terracidiphilus sp.]|nr:hypothetical protein [Terracidiphilus sp.]
MSEYNEKLKDPRWQRRRLEIFQRDNWQCQLCSRTDLELHVHHLYRTTENPWDEPDLHLLTVCRLCHEQQPSTPQGTIKPPKREYRTDAEWWAEHRDEYDSATQTRLSLSNVHGLTLREAMASMHRIEAEIHTLRLARDEKGAQSKRMSLSILNGGQQFPPGASILNVLESLSSNLDDSHKLIRECTKDWLELRLDELSPRLADPLTEDQINALNDVFTGERDIMELLAWLEEDSKMEWNEFF